MKPPTRLLQYVLIPACKLSLVDLLMSRQKDFLGQLISVMCEANEIGRLNSLGFIGFQKDVEATLAFKARNSDLRSNYYNVLYSWQISRGDYRSGEYSRFFGLMRSW